MRESTPGAYADIHDNGSMKTMKRLGQMLIQPDAALRELKVQPTFLVPLALVVVGALATNLLYFRMVDFPWLLDALVNGNPRLAAMPDEQRAQAAAMITRQSMMISAVVGALAGVPLLRLLEATCYLLSGKATRLGFGFRQWFALSAWAALPTLFAVPLALIAMALHSNGQLMPEQLQLTSLNEIFFHLPAANRWANLLSNVTLLQLWSWGLTALGVREWSGRSWTFSVVFSAIPSLLALAAWVAYIVLAG